MFDPALDENEVGVVSALRVARLLGVVAERDQEGDAVVTLLGVVQDGDDGTSCLGPVGSMFGGGDQVLFLAVGASTTGDGEGAAEPLGSRAGS